MCFYGTEVANKHFYVARVIFTLLLLIISAGEDQIRAEKPPKGSELNLMERWETENGFCSDTEVVCFCSSRPVLSLSLNCNTSELININQIGRQMPQRNIIYFEEG